MIDPMSRQEKEAAIRARIEQLAAEGREVEREVAAWELAALIMRGCNTGNSFNPRRRIRWLRYPMIEAN